MDSLISPVLSPEKDDFHKELDLYRRTQPFKPEYIGMNNPYDHSKINNVQDYDLYLREKLYHDLCERSMTVAFHNQVQRYKSRCIWLCIVIAALLFAFILPIATSVSRADGYQSGQAVGLSAGYEEGLLVGYKDGHTDGYKEGSASATETQYRAGYLQGERDGYASGYSAGLQDSNPPTITLPIFDDVFVYITKTGNKYHRSNCSYLDKSKYETTLSSAKSSGYTPCSKCDPPN